MQKDGKFRGVIIKLTGNPGGQLKNKMLSSTGCTIFFCKGPIANQCCNSIYLKGFLVLIRYLHTKDCIYMINDNKNKMSHQIEQHSVYKHVPLSLPYPPSLL